MMESKPMSLPEEQPVLAQPAEPTAEEKEQRLAEMAAQSFFYADMLLRKTNLGRGAVIRAIRAALHEDLTDTQLKLLSQEEKNMAVAFYEMLTARTIMQAQLIKNANIKKGENNEQSSESAESIGNSQTEVG